MNFKGCFSLTKTATGILFKFSHPEDYQAVFKKGFHKVTNARFYRKIAVPCRPQKTFTLFVFDVPEEIPIEDVRHSLFRFNSVVEVVRLILHPQVEPTSTPGKEIYTILFGSYIKIKFTYIIGKNQSTLKAHHLLNHKSLIKLQRNEKNMMPEKRMLHRRQFASHWPHLTNTIFFCKMA